MTEAQLVADIRARVDALEREHNRLLNWIDFMLDEQAKLIVAVEEHGNAACRREVAALLESQLERIRAARDDGLLN